MKRKDVLRQAILDLSPNPSTSDQKPTTPAPKIRTESLTTQHDIDNPVIGTGVFVHDSTDDISYELLLRRLFLQQDYFPSLNTYGKNERQVVKPHLVVVGKKRTIFANVVDVYKDLKRDKDHVTQFICAELGTNGSFDEYGRLVLKGRFVAKQTENCVRRYYATYVKCSSCESTNTDLRKTDTRVMLVTCHVCDTEARVPAIKRGCTLTVGKRRKLKEEPQKEPDPELQINSATGVTRGPGHHCIADFIVKSKL